MAEKSLSIITPVWNQAALTRQFLLQNYRLYFDRDDLEFVIIDNGSTDNTSLALELSELKPVVKHNQQNEGFPIACNQGAKAAMSEYLLFLNNDVYIYGDYVSPLLRTLRAHEGKALVGAELLSHNTGWNVFGNRPPISYLPGWCLGIGKATFEALGGFDERYSPADYEDMDLCYNAVQSGYVLVSLPLPLSHLSGQTGAQLPNRRIITEQNRAKFGYKWGLI